MACVDVGSSDADGVAKLLLTSRILGPIARPQLAARLVAVARSTLRSVRFDLDAAIGVARIVDNAGGLVSPDLLAAGLGYSGTNNGTFLTRLANARLFGLVGGRGARLELTDRGRLLLRGDPAGAAVARQEAFLSVPLFRAVVGSLPETGASMNRSELAALLSERFGEPPDKAPVVAAKLLDSARQAGLAYVGSDGKSQLSADPELFTTVDNHRQNRWRRPVVKFAPGAPGASGARADTASGSRGGDVDDERIWLDEDSPGTSQGHRRGSRRRSVGVVAAVAVCAALIAVPIAVAATGGGPTLAAQHHHAPPVKAKTLGNGPAEHEVLGALSATTDANTFDFSYQLSTTPPTTSVPTTTSTTVCHAITLPARTVTPPGAVQTMPTSRSAAVGAAASSSGGGYISASASASVSKKGTVVQSSSGYGVATSGSGPRISAPVVSSNGKETVTECTGGPVTTPETPVTGSGVANVNPKAMLVRATVGSSSGLMVTVRVDSTTLYEDLGTLETSLAPPTSMANASGQSISGFAGITESTIGTREGSIAMLGMASPTGYLDLYQQDVDGATRTGTSTIDGAPVTVYQVAVDPTQLLNDPGITSEEAQTASASIKTLDAQGYTGTTDTVSIDASGYIREVDSVAHFSDGGTVVLDVMLSNFGCAGTVLMPGQQGPSQPPAGCTSPAAAQSAPAAPTTTLAPRPTVSNPATTQPIRVPPMEVPPSSTTTTSLAPATTTTNPSPSTTTATTS